MPAPVALDLAGLARLAARITVPFRQRMPPSGPHAVGTMTITVPARERLSRASSRELSAPEPEVCLWYPALTTRTPAISWQRLRERWQDRLRTRPAREAAPWAMAIGILPVPLLLYFPGWPGTRLQNLTLVCELVSHGYAVASLRYPEPPPARSPVTGSGPVMMLDRPMQDYSSDGAFRASLKANDERLWRNVDDAGRVLDELMRLDAHDPARGLTGRLDLQKIGILGYSFGGAVAAEFRRQDSRVKAAVNIDGRHWGNALRSGTPPPYLFIGEALVMPTEAALSSPDPPVRYEALLDRVDYGNLTGHLREQGGIRITIDGTTHANFCDDILRSPLRRFAGGGSIDALRALGILNRLVLGFFDQSLRDQPCALLAGGSSGGTDVKVEVFPGRDQGVA